MIPTSSTTNSAPAGCQHRRGGVAADGSVGDRCGHALGPHGDALPVHPVVGSGDQQRRPNGCDGRAHAGGGGERNRQVGQPAEGPWGSGQRIHPGAGGAAGIGVGRGNRPCQLGEICCGKAQVGPLAGLGCSSRSPVPGRPIRAVHPSCPWLRTTTPPWPMVAANTWSGPQPQVALRAARIGPAWVMIRWRPAANASRAPLTLKATASYRSAPGGSKPR